MFSGRWCGPFLDSFELGRVHGHFAFFQDHSEVFDARLGELAFAGFQVEVIFSQFLEYDFGDPFEAFSGS